MDEDLKLVEPSNAEQAEWGLATIQFIAGLEDTITRLHAEIEALKSDVSDLVRAGSDEATENERLVKERDAQDVKFVEVRDQLMATIERLVKERDYAWQEKKNAEAYLKPERANAIAAEARAETAEAQRDAALEALRPFAEVGMRYCQPSRADMGDDWLAAAHSFNIGHFRAASRTLEGVKP